MFDTLWQDVRFGFRTLRATPAVTATAIISLALGIGANTSMFTIVNAALLRPLPVAQPHELAFVYSTARNMPWGTTSYLTYLEYRDRNDVFSGLAAYGEINVSLGSAGDDRGPELVRGLVATGNYFDVLGVRAAHGRVLTANDDRVPGGHPVAVIAHDLWNGRFDNDPAIVGREVTINGRPYTIVGVLPEGFRGANLLEDYQIYIPMMMQSAVRPPRGGFSGEMDPDLLKRRGTIWLSMIGRLRPGVTFDQAQAGLRTVAQQIEQTYPDTNRGYTASVYPAAQVDPRAYPVLRTSALLLMGVVATVLLIATANVTNLLLARTLTRRREIAVRLALGGSRARLIRQLLTESVMLSGAAAILGVLAASWTIDALRRFVPTTGIFSFTLDFPIDWRVLVFTSSVALTASLLTGLAPALQSSRADLVPALKSGDALAAGGRRGPARSALVVAQLAMSIVLLVMAGLFMKSFRVAQGIRAGFDVDAIATAALQIDLLRYSKPRAQQFYRDVVERVEALPGVTAASLVRVVPLSDGSRTTPLQLEGDQAPEAGAQESSRPVVATNVVGLRYFETMGVGFVAGRDFSAQDTEAAPGVVVVNDAFAAKYFPGRSAIGQQVRLGSGRPTPAAGRFANGWREIVGVVRDSKYRSLAEPPTPFVYQALGQQHELGMTLLVRTSRDAGAIVSDVRTALLALEPNLPVSSIQPMTAVLASALFPARMAARLLSVFAILAAVLAALGLYSAISFAVSRRTRELGVRAALGARRGDLISLVMRESVALVALGLAIGIAIAAATARLLAGFFYDVSPTDPATFAAVSLLLVVVMLAATFFPARRASRSDPLTALRAE